MDVAPRHDENIMSLLHAPLVACWEGGSRRLGVLRPVPWTDVTRLLFLAVHAYADDMQPVPSQSSHMVNYYATSVRFLDPKI